MIRWFRRYMQYRAAIHPYPSPRWSTEQEEVNARRREETEHLLEGRPSVRERHSSSLACTCRSSVSGWNPSWTNTSPCRLNDEYICRTCRCISSCPTKKRMFSFVLRSIGMLTSIFSTTVLPNEHALVVTQMFRFSSELSKLERAINRRTDPSNADVLTEKSSDRLCRHSPDNSCWPEEREREERRVRLLRRTDSYPNFDHIEGILGSFVVEILQHREQIDNLAHFDTLKRERLSWPLPSVDTYFRFHIGSCLLTNMKEMVSLKEKQIECESSIDRVTYRIEITFRFDIASEFHQSHPIATDESCC